MSSHPPRPSRALPAPPLEVGTAATTMGGPMCIHGYSGEYAKKFDKLFILYNRAINLAFVCININQIIGTKPAIVQLARALHAHLRVVGSNRCSLAIFYLTW
jgi:hypothetical protein